ncbi:hypothetical protein U1Q18_000645, partial [Sarracenia purpurea var. burkii]
RPVFGFYSEIQEEIKGFNVGAQAKKMFTDATPVSVQSVLEELLDSEITFIPSGIRCDSN